MNRDIITKALNIILLSAIVVLLTYAWLYAIPEQTELFKQCEEKILCQRGILEGQLCDDYERIEEYSSEWNLTSIVATTSTTII